MTVERSSDLPDLPGEGEQQIRQRLRAFENANTDRVPEALIAVYIRDVRSLLALLDTERAKLSAALGAADFHQQRTVFLEQQVASLSADLARREQEIARLRLAIDSAVEWLQPGPCGQHNCYGCLCEMQLAHDELKRALRRGDEPSSLPMSGQPGDASNNAAKIHEGTAEATPPLPVPSVSGETRTTTDE